ncbi:hypothetical protein KDL01_06420 [Actinospica durhamensis]|uniref:Caspase domain-containing protein n=1 Tax=Actinospica durhamensis TaxID=1508375 RepID=A0A941IQG1_9ACTN|nr:hypothetical protein [Actinospica durhamensis]MBR7832888.1 hypothetical protein [Actinospica durhamensis]
MPSRALIIGPSRYGPDSGLQDHASIARSARMYGEVLGQDPRWGAENVEVLTEDRLGSGIEVMDAVTRAAAEAGRDPDSTLLIVYIGHGIFWSDVPGGAEVHFAVGSSRRAEPYTWLSSWYIYYAMRKSEAKRKVLIADCCYSDRLGHLGGDPAEAAGAAPTLSGGIMTGVLRAAHNSSCVFTAANEDSRVEAGGCTSPILDENLRGCTPFSAHLLNVLKKGTADHVDVLTIGMIRDAVERDMIACKRHRNTMRMVLNDAREYMPLFSNKSTAEERLAELPNPSEPEGWVDLMLTESGVDLDPLLTDPVKAGRVVALLSERPEDLARRKAEQIVTGADERFREAEQFARFWNSSHQPRTRAA